MHWKNVFRLKWPVLILLLPWSFPANAQIKRDRRGESEKHAEREAADSANAPLSQLPFWKRLTYGGSGGASFGNITFIDASPLVGYRITEDFTSGLGITYQYYREKFPGYPIYTTSIYGGRAFAQHAFLKNFLAYAEYGLLNRPYETSYGADRRIWVGSPLVGGGYRQAVGPRSYIQVLALYNLNYNPNTSIYASPLIFRVGFLL